MTIAFRTLEPADRRFVVDSWARSYQMANTAGLVQLDDWLPIMIPQIGRVIDRVDVTTMVAYDPETPPPADLYGFITADVSVEPALVYYVFVKQSYRGRGLARVLFRAIDVDPDAPFLYVCDTPVVGTLRRAGKIPLARWKPVLGRIPKTEWRTPCPIPRAK